MVPEFETLSTIINEMKPKFKYKLELEIIQKKDQEYNIFYKYAQFKHAQKNSNKQQHISRQTITLLINNIEVNAYIKNELRKAITSQDIRYYFLKKYKWTSSTTDIIDWEIHSKALSNTKGSMRKSIRQFIHEWLPLNGHSGTGKQENDRLCPHCMNHIETPGHFLTCRAPQSTQLWEAELLKLENIMIKSTDPILMKLYIYALEHWNDKKEPEYPTFISKEYKTLFLQQKLIGWNQISKGRLTLEWVRMHDKYMLQNNKKPNGALYFQQTIQRTWNIIYSLWKERCHSQHNKDLIKEDTYMYLHYKIRANKLYNQSNDVDVCDRQLFDRPLEEILQLPIYQMKKWLERNERFMKDAIRRSRHCSKLSSKGIKNYFIPLKQKIVIVHPIQPKTIHHKKYKAHKNNRFKKVGIPSNTIEQSKNTQSLITSHLPRVKLKQISTPSTPLFPTVKLRRKFNIPGSNANAQFRPP